ncbi:hypothetical protein WBJ53_27135 [Spirosoma sp. SC4-14]|uniref:hypothetical protein n=1 Tax=Spirosoma sp. SC4-14 TaxID=3128900 RepID=UPI0030D546FF
MPTSTAVRQALGLSFFLIRFLFSSTVFAQTSSPSDSSKATPFDTLKAQLEAEQKRIMDPALGRVPYERLGPIQDQLATKKAPGAITNGIPNVTWQERGPSNAGGRTRALLFDPNDPNHKKVWAGSVAGGLWFSPDITATNPSWTPVGDDWANLVITALAADPSNPQIMYAGTGNIYEYSSGGGIWKTTNGGQSWNRLTSTIPGGSYPSIGTAFYYIQRIAVNNAGHVFAATQYGVARSTDGGTTWSYTLAPAQNIGATGTSTNAYDDKVTDLEIGSDGTVYAAFNPTKLYKSTNGTTWTDITPAGSPTGERTELALAPSTSGTSQVVYAVTRKYNSTNYGQDALWFKKSTNGGTSWTDITIPTYGNSAIYHFTGGDGYSALSLTVYPTDPNIIYAGGAFWFRSTDGGSTWSQSSTDYAYQHGLVLQPGSSVGAVVYNDKGTFWSADWGNTTTAQPTLLDRNAGYRAGEASSAAMRSSAGSQYLIGTMTTLGLAKLTQANLSPASYIYASGSQSGITFIDEETPNVQLFSQWGNYYLYDNNSYPQYLFYSNGNYGVADYDSPTNVLYVADVANNANAIRRVAGIGSGSTTTTYLSLTGVTDSPSFIKLSRDRSTLFIGLAYSGKLYKMTGLTQTTPTLTAIDNNAFPQYSTISGIEVGATANELIVILSNYGVKSVWYTNDGGTTWTSKDEASYGLPDIPVYTVMVNPQNYKQVLLGTEVGVWSSNDITASNPNWSFSNAGMANVRVNQLRYRASDGKVVAATTGRGIFSSDIFAIPYTLPSITLTGISNMSLCAGNTFSVSFTTSGPAFVAGNQFEVWISDAAGDFTNAQRIGTGSTSPIAATLPSGSSAFPYGTNYKIKVIATNPDVESGQSSALAIGDLTYASVNDRSSLLNQYSNGGTICTGSQTTLYAIASSTNSNTATAESYVWSLNGNVISITTSSTLAVQQAGIYTVVAKKAGCSATGYDYTLYVQNSIYSYVISASDGEPQCDDHPLKLQARYNGNNASFQWTRDGVDIAGATSYTYAATQTGTYAHRVTDGGCSTSSSSSYFQFGRSLYARAYLTSPGDSLLCTASNYYNLIYADVSTSNGSDFKVQWYRDGIALPYETNQNTWVRQPGIYTFLLKQGTCQTMSNPVVLRDIGPITVNIKYDFRSKSVCPGETRYLYASSSYSGSFQWQKDGVDIPGATSSNYTATQTGNYTVKLTRGTCSATSAPISLTFSNALQPSIYFYGPSPVGCTSTFLGSYDSYNLSGYQYQWYRNGTLLNNATDQSYIVTQSGAYSVRMTNGGCTGVSKETYVTIGNAQKPSVNATPTTKLCGNNTVKLTANSNTGSLQWKRNGVAITGATYYQYFAIQSGIYSVSVQDGSCQAESDPVEVKIGEPTSATISGSALVSSGQAALLPVSFTGPAPWSFTLSNGQSATAIYQNPYLMPVTPTSNTTYQITSLVNACGTGTTSGQASVTVGSGSADVSLAMAVNNRTPNVNDVVSYSLTATNDGPQDATGIKLQSRLPAGLAFVNATTPGVTFANGIVSADVGTVMANGQVTVGFQAKPTQTGTFATAAQITSSQTPDPDSQPNSGTGDGQDDAAMVDLRTPAGSNPLTTSPNPNQIALPLVVSSQPTPDPATADLSLAMVADKAVVNTSQNEIVTSTITLSNRGGATAHSAIILVTLPNGYFDYQNTANWVQVNNQTYKVYVNQLAAGQSSVVTVRWQPAAAGSLQAQIQDVAESDPDSTPGNGFSNGEDDEASISVRVR